MFDQRLLRPSSDQFYFQLVPNILTINNQALIKKFKSTNTIFKFKMTKGVSSCDETKKGASLTANNGKIVFEKTQLNFFLPSFNPARDIQFNLILLKQEEGAEVQEMGRFSIKSSQYINEFKQNSRKYYEESIQFNEDFLLVCSLYIDANRFNLEKFVRQFQESKLTGKEIKKDPSTIRPKTEVMSDTGKGQIVNSAENRFMSPTRKIVRKTGDRKLLVKNSSPQRSQGGGSQASSQNKRDLKFLAKEAESKLPPVRQSLAQKEAKVLDQKKQQAREAVLKKNEEEEQRRRQQQAKQRTRKQAEKRKLDAQKKRQQEQQRKRIESEKAAKQAEKVAKEEQRAQKLEESRRIRQQKLKEEQDARKKPTPTSAGSKYINKRQSEVASEPNDLDAKIFSRTSSGIEAPKQKNDSSIRNKSPMPAKRESISSDPLQATRHQPIKVDWNKPVTFKRTDSSLFDNSGNLLKSSGQGSSSGKKEQRMDMKTRAFMIGFTILSILLMYNAMSPSRKF